MEPKGNLAMTEVTIEGQKPPMAINAQAEIVLPALLEKDQIKANQDVIRTSLLSIDLLIHNNVIQCYLHAEKHGDTSLMRRLLVDIIDAKTGYRRQGVIAHMRKFTPMELSGDTIKLTGLMSDGETKRPWLIEEANKTPFTGLAEAAERLGKPVYRDTLMSKVNQAMKEWRAAQENTLIGEDGKPVAIDKTKPYYQGLHMDAVDAFFKDVGGALVTLNSKPDDTLVVQKARETAAKANAELTALTGEKKTA